MFCGSRSQYLSNGARPCPCPCPYNTHPPAPFLAQAQQFNWFEIDESPVFTLFLLESSRRTRPTSPPVFYGVCVCFFFFVFYLQFSSPPPPLSGSPSPCERYGESIIRRAASPTNFDFPPAAATLTYTTALRHPPPYHRSFPHGLPRHIHPTDRYLHPSNGPEIETLCSSSSTTSFPVHFS